MQTQCTSQDMQFTLSFTTTEKSKDSHSIVENWKLDGKELIYNRNFGGRLSSKKPERKSVKLNNDQIREIEGLFIEKSLHKNIPPDKHNEFHAPYTAIYVHLSIRHNDENYDIHLYDLASQLPEDETYQSIDSVVKILKGFINF